LKAPPLPNIIWPATFGLRVRNIRRDTIRITRVARFRTTPKPELPMRASSSSAVRLRAAGVMVEALDAVSSAVTRAPAPECFQTVLDELSALLELRAAALAVFGQDDAWVRSFHAWTRGGETAALVAFTEGVAHRMRGAAAPLVLENAWVELPPPVTPQFGDPLDTSVVAVPLTGASGTTGSLAILREHSAGDQRDFPFDADVRMLRTVATLLELAMRAGAVPANDAPPAGARLSATLPLAALGALGAAPCWREIERKLQAAARTNTTILLRGETGVGKTLMARAVHAASPRREGPFVVVNCAALAESVLESELFGHEKGAFTGAVAQRKGRFELAHGGTLFLDEIGELSPSFQAKLLRVLQLGEFERVGGTATLSVDARIIAATHRDIEAAVREETFRADLYYRLCVVPICIPPLRERPEDIPVLARSFVERFNAENGTRHRLAGDALRVLECHQYPGNVRELENAVRRAASLASTYDLTGVDFSFLAGQSDIGDQSRPMKELDGECLPAPESSPPPSAGGRLVDREQLLDALQRSGWIIARAARLLALTPRQVSYAVTRHGISVRKY
jgi:Nif-specific regulatory protein